jgi:hypothetical protein
VPIDKRASESHAPAYARQATDNQPRETRDSPKQPATNSTNEVTVSTRLPTSSLYQHDKGTCPECLSNERCPFAPTQHSPAPTCTTSPAQTQSQTSSSVKREQAFTAIQRDVEAYEPLKRWEDETFREQPWHGIRELMLDEVSAEDTTSCEEAVEILAHILSVGEHDKGSVADFST